VYEGHFSSFVSGLSAINDSLGNSGTVSNFSTPRNCSLSLTFLGNGTF
jgi:hypothetical protein